MNLIPNPSAADATGWTFNQGGTHYPDFGRDALGCLYLPAAETGTPTANSPVTPVTVGVTYTARFFAHCTAWPPPILYWSARESDANGTYLQQKRLTLTTVSTTAGWVESVALYTPPVGVASVRIKVQRYAPMNGYPAGEVYLDDFSMCEGVDLPQAEPKRPFVSSRVNVDSGGNVDVAGAPVFLRMIYPSTDDTKDWNLYSGQGFNVVNQCNDAARVQKAQDAGLYAAFSLDKYLVDPTLADYGNTAGITQAIEDIDAAGVLGNVVLYTWDNEANVEDWDNVAAVIAAVRAADPDAPIYALNSNVGLARLYNHPQHPHLQDIVGAYVIDDGRPSGLTENARTPDQRSPTVIAQLNGLEASPAAELRTRVYKAVLEGARGFCIYADDRASAGIPPAEQQPWWPELPALAAEIDALLPALRAT